MKVSGSRTRGAVAWSWVVDGVLDGKVTEAPFEPLVYRYSLEIDPPPSPDDGTDPVPTDLGADGIALAVGWPLLVEPATDAFPALEVDADALMDWAAGARSDPSGVVTSTDGARVAAGTTDHVLVLLSAEDEDVGRLATAPTWDPGSSLCRFDGAVVGLTLYRSAGVGCFGWEALAPAGSRTEFQGIPVAPP